MQKYLLGRAQEATTALIMPTYHAGLCSFSCRLHHPQHVRHVMPYALSGCCPQIAPAGLYDPKWLRRHVALVSQEPVLFARSVRRNICYGMEQDDGCAAAPTQVRNCAQCSFTKVCCAP
eukprot:GHRQ01025792.1.p1 GENE.GHRQ01025792.1~~GHRQ01025792.1.p1  ORF type:complete len:119 (-),score=14.88 GHRQ01025792.1:1239-1595(-)